jgi:hypothetical protein
MPRDQVEEFQELARGFAAPQGTDPVLEALIKAREWLSEPTHWHQDPDCYEDGRGATCAWGATQKFRERSQPCTDDCLLDIQARALGFGCAASFNDDPNTTHADVLALFDRAIAARAALSKAGA